MQLGQSNTFYAIVNLVPARGIIFCSNVFIEIINRYLGCPARRKPGISYSCILKKQIMLVSVCGFVRKIGVPGTRGNPIPEHRGKNPINPEMESAIRFNSTCTKTPYIIRKHRCWVLVRIFNYSMHQYRVAYQIARLLLPISVAGNDNIRIFNGWF